MVPTLGKALKEASESAELGWESEPIPEMGDAKCGARRADPREEASSLQPAVGHDHATGFLHGLGECVLPMGCLPMPEGHPYHGTSSGQFVLKTRGGVLDKVGSQGRTPLSIQQIHKDDSSGNTSICWVRLKSPDASHTGLQTSPLMVAPCKVPLP